MKNLSEIQNGLMELGLDAWLLYDFRGINPIAENVAGVAESHLTRRWFCLIPVRGEPKWLVHRIEKSTFITVRGQITVYASWQELQANLKSLLSDVKNVAMEYSPNGVLPYISRVDGGTLEWLSSFDITVHTSSELAQRVEARLNREQILSHQSAARSVLSAKDSAFTWIGMQLSNGKKISEYDVQQFLLQKFEEAGLVTDYPPIVAVNANSSNPHYSPSASDTSPIQIGDFILIDLWAKQKTPDAVFADTTWVAYAGASVPSQYAEIFEILKEARDRGVAFIREKWETTEPVHGYAVDDCVRGYIREKGYGQFFIHRTGHNIGTVVHGNGVNLDNLEMRDERALIPGVCFSIEPGIYLTDFGVRTEIDVLLGERGRDGVKVTTAPVQNQVLPLLRLDSSVSSGH